MRLLEQFELCSEFRLFASKVDDHTMVRNTNDIQCAGQFDLAFDLGLFKKRGSFKNDYHLLWLTILLAFALAERSWLSKRLKFLLEELQRESFGTSPEDRSKASVRHSLSWSDFNEVQRLKFNITNVILEVLHWKFKVAILQGRLCDWHREKLNKTQ